MHVKRLYIDGFKRLTEFRIELNPTINVIVGDNEAGKTSVLEAMHLVLSRRFENRDVEYSLDPYLFNARRTAEYIRTVRGGQNTSPPRIRIEAYLAGDSDEFMLSTLRGTNNTLNEDCPGITLLIEPDDAYTDEIKEYVRDPGNPELIPVEYYRARWLSFANNTLTSRTVPIRAAVVDTSVVRSYRGPDRYLAQVVSDVLAEDDRHQLSLAYKKLRHDFGKQQAVASINDHLKRAGSVATRKQLSVEMDMSSRSTWDSAITAHLDGLPFDCIGKGEQSRIQMLLAIAGATESKVLLVEEPENHLSHANMNMLLEDVRRLSAKQQVILTTHSAFVLNKLGLNNLRLMSPKGETASLSTLTADTRDYFMKLPGYDTLRLILARRCILVEGPSDELIVQRAYKDLHGKLPLDDGIDVISVGSLAFKRFLEIAALLNLEVRVITDNDRSVCSLREKYKDYMDGRVPSIKILFDVDETAPTLEPQLLKANTLERLNKIVDKHFQCDEQLLRYMSKHKTDCALQLFSTEERWSAPEYIANALR